MENFDLMPFLAMVILQGGYAGMSFVSKLAMDDRINPFVLVTYRHHHHHPFRLSLGEEDKTEDYSANPLPYIFMFHHWAQRPLPSYPVTFVFALIFRRVVCSAVAFCVMTWFVHRKGPLYTSVFSPLLFVMSTLLSWALLCEKLYVGILVGAVFIIVGLYSVLWGNGKEVEEARIIDVVEVATKHREKEDSESELHLHVNSESRQDPY